MKVKIRLEGVEFFAYHGVFDFEKKQGQLFKVDVSFDSEISDYFADELNETIDYSEVYKLVKQEMDIPAHLLETVGNRILNAIRDYDNTISNISVKITKINPPIEHFQGQISVELNSNL